VTGAATMPRGYSKGVLRTLRNDIPIAEVIADLLEVPSKISEGYFRFLCPLCHEFNTATNPKTNLARCFRCRQNFNPIDFVMAERHWSFVEAVQFLVDNRALPSTQENPHAYELTRHLRPDRAPSSCRHRHARDGAGDDPPEPLSELSESR
jgi:DNA primase